MTLNFIPDGKSKAVGIKGELDVKKMAGGEEKKDGEKNKKK